MRFTLFVCVFWGTTWGAGHRAGPWLLALLVAVAWFLLVMDVVGLYIRSTRWEIPCLQEEDQRREQSEEAGDGDG